MNNGVGCDVVWGNEWARCEFAVGWDIDAVVFDEGRFEVVVFFDVNGRDEEAEIEGTVFDFIFDVVGISAEELIGDIGVAFLKFEEDIAQDVAAFVFAAADGNLSIWGIASFNFFFCFVDHIDDFLGASLEDFSVRCEDDAVTASCKEFDAEFIFELHDLSREGGLSDVE